MISIPIYYRKRKEKSTLNKGKYPSIAGIGINFPEGLDFFSLENYHNVWKRWKQ